ncbi:MAG: prepilin peptidase [Propionibacteriales bacterium]|nr:prepilin peptidase [Propionibacteriales bacterium]
MPTLVIAALLAAVSAGAVAVATGRLLHWLPVPDEEPRADFIGLDSLRFRLGVGAVGFLAGGLLLGLTEVTLWPILLPLASLGALLGVIDARTTYLPLRLHYLTFALVTVGILISAFWRAEPWSLAWAGGIGMAAAALYAVVWRLSGGQLGFGDVRLAGMLGAATAAAAPTLALWTFLLGSMVGAVWALAARVRGIKEFAYGPSMLLGVPAAVVVTHLLLR